MSSKSPATARELFSHRLDLSLSDKLFYLLLAPILVPIRIFLALVIALLIYSTSKIGLIGSDPAVKRKGIIVKTILHLICRLETSNLTRDGGRCFRTRCG